MVRRKTGGASMNRIAIGQRFNRLTFLGMVARRSPDKHLVGTWKCTCGNIFNLAVTRVVLGRTQSCGCLKGDTKPGLTHGMKGTPTYSSWSAMKSRCNDPQYKHFQKYGAKGIKVCLRWYKFENFLEDMGERPPGTSIDRFPNRNGHYQPGNCRWATPSEQQRNKNNFVWIDSPLGRIPLMDYAAKIGITRGAAHLRLKRGKLEGCTKCA